MTIRTGRDAGFYINTGTDSQEANRIWTYCGEIKDLNLDRSADEIEFPCRGGGRFKQYITGQVDYEVSVDIAHDCPRDGETNCWNRLEGAFQVGIPIHVIILDGVISGSPLISGVGQDLPGCGFHFTAEVISFNWSQPLNEGMVDSITLKPSINGFPFCDDPELPQTVYIPDTTTCITP